MIVFILKISKNCKIIKIIFSLSYKSKFYKDI